MRPNTERPITVTHGTNRLVAPSEVVAAAREILAGPVRPTGPRPPLWDGHAGERIADEIVAWLTARTAGDAHAAPAVPA
jgi:UDP-N-acetylglucosamine 2-epimerase (non-hydrolysing)